MPSLPHPDAESLAALLLHELLHELLQNTDGVLRIRKRRTPRHIFELLHELLHFAKGRGDIGEPGGDRTLDPLIKSQVLCH